MDTRLDANALLRRAREKGHDTLGVGHDPEAWQSLADSSRERFVQSGDTADLEGWVRFTTDVAGVEWLGEPACEWVLMQIALLGTLSETRLPRERFEQVARTFAHHHPEHGERIRPLSDEVRRMVAALGTAHVTTLGASSLFRGLTDLFRLQDAATRAHG